MKLKNQIAFVTVRSNEEMLPNMRAVYDRTNGKKVVFTRMMPYDDEQMERRFRRCIPAKWWLRMIIFTYAENSERSRDRNLCSCGMRPVPSRNSAWMEQRSFREVDHLYHKDYDLVSVSGENVRGIYAGAFGVEEDRVKAYGVPRTDKLLDAEYVSQVRKRIITEHPNLAGKQIILYAPTFGMERDSKHDFRPEMDFESLSGFLK